VSGEFQFDVVVVGGGPAGLAAAATAAENGARTALVDDNARLGGQIWRASTHESTNRESENWQLRAVRSGVKTISGDQIEDCPAPGLLIGEGTNSHKNIRYSRLVLATGARELLLPFPGWTLPNVCGAGGLQALVKSGLNIRGKRVAVAGTGPLLLAVASYLRRHGAEIQIIAEQAGISKLGRFSMQLCSSWTKLRQAMKLRQDLLGIPYRTSCWPVAARGEGVLREVEFRGAREGLSISCDYLACGFGLIPNLEVPRLLGCDLRGGFVVVDERQKTSVESVYCAGESTGIGGVDAAICEGRIAGLAAAGRSECETSLLRERARWKSFECALSSAFAIRSELREMCDDATTICRCEDVTCGRLRRMQNWREAKLQTRCGMGACQGRTCGAITEFLFDWHAVHTRPPVFPARVETLIGKATPVEH
jgi:NADPH-dependent 2,4-dienoyl-CoA reductase/sulfur reductase-like enzyme